MQTSGAGRARKAGWDLRVGAMVDETIAEQGSVDQRALLV